MNVTARLDKLYGYNLQHRMRKHTIFNVGPLNLKATAIAQLCCKIYFTTIERMKSESAKDL